MQCSWLKVFQIYRWVFFLSFAFSLAADGQSGYFIIIVAVVFSFTVDEQVFFFVNQILTIVFGHFIIGNELNGIGRTGFFAKTAVNAAGEIDSEKFRIAPAVFVFSGLQGNAIDRTGGGTEVTSYTAFTHVWVTGEYDPAPPSCWQGCFLFGILVGFPLMEHMQEREPHGSY